MGEQLTPLEAVRYDKDTGLVPVIVQDAESGQVLMMAYANREALKRSFGTGYAWFWSRSRQEYWQKGATSGHLQRIVEIRVDCDGDAVLYRVNPQGPACHTGETTCFYRTLQHGGQGPVHADKTSRVLPSSLATASSQAEDLPFGTAPQAHGSDAPVSSAESSVDLGEVLRGLWDILEQRWRERPEGSYTSYLFEHGVDKVAKKVGEESAEVVIAAKNAVMSDAGKPELASESADLLYHLLALWKTAGVTPHEVAEILQSRHR